jgi:murein L,D-transpeptidase YcbB/YkuD
MFPNPYMVYLHDTPSKTLFGKASRAFSHGCIRVQDPLRLAELLLEALPEWGEAAMERTLASNKTTTVLLPEPLTVMLLYWTAEVSEDGTVVFKKDIYNRDAAVIRGLNDPFEFSPPHDLPEDLVGR